MPISRIIRPQVLYGNLIKFIFSLKIMKNLPHECNFDAKMCTKLFSIDINRENTPKQPLNSDFDAFVSGIECTYVGDCSPSIDMFMIYRIFSVHDST
jgi:hypothetical protein